MRPIKPLDDLPNGHAMQGVDASSSLSYLSSRHDVHAVEPTPASLPAGQSAHESWPAADLRPALQAAHTVLEFESLSNWPAAQSVHCEDSAPAYVPALQLSQAVRPATEAVPAGHADGVSSTKPPAS